MQAYGLTWDAVTEYRSFGRKNVFSISSTRQGERGREFLVFVPHVTYPVQLSPQWFSYYSFLPNKAGPA